MAGYTRQSTFSDGDTITAAIFNNEYNAIANAFHNQTGHKHDGTAAEGPVIGVIGDAGVTTPLNKVLIDTTNDHIEFWIDDSSSSVQQLYIGNGVIAPVTDSDIDIGTTALRFKDAYIDTLTTTSNVSVGGNLTVTGTTTLNGGTLTLGDAASDNVVFGADVDSSIIPDDDDTYDLGSTTQEWRNLFIDGTANIDSLVLGSGATVTSILDEDVVEQFIFCAWKQKRLVIIETASLSTEMLDYYRSDLRLDYRKTRKISKTYLAKGKKTELEKNEELLAIAFKLDVNSHQSLVVLEEIQTRTFSKYQKLLEKILEIKNRRNS